jgi:hypothetical protein
MVTCCLEPTRVEILKSVIKNIQEQAPELVTDLTVFDNASNQPDVHELLYGAFKNVYVADSNVGYWTAIDWWLRSLESDPPKYTYIIESDMMHYDFNKIWTAASYLDTHPEIGAVRLHEYDYDNRHLYDKDRPLPESRRNIWQSHTNKVNGKRVSFEESEQPGILKTTFLTQLPALNRYSAMVESFRRLRGMPKFSELDFQRAYYVQYPINAILDGGIFNADAASWGTKTVTGSWSTPEELAKIGYKSTRYANIVGPEGYKVTRL